MREKRKGQSLLKGNLVIACESNGYKSTRTGFFQNAPLSSFFTLRVLFINPKHNFFQKVAFYT